MLILKELPFKNPSILSIYVKFPGCIFSLEWAKRAVCCFFQNGLYDGVFLLKNLAAKTNS